MSAKQITLFQTWNKDFKGDPPETSSKFNNKLGTTSGRAQGKKTKLAKNNEEDDIESLWKQDISVLQPGPSTSNAYHNSHYIPDFDVDAGKTWIYPTNYPMREYQFSIVQKAMFQNTLVVLPTGLGKTFIAAVVMYNLYRWYPKGKVVFMAPTRPLVAQQVDACFKITGIPQDDTAQMTGTMLPIERKRTWQTKRVFFLTPQILTNDLARNICPAIHIKCLVVDEAHKALGNHAYCQVVRDLFSQTTQFRILALTATPGSDTQAVKQVIENLLISHVELRTEDSDDIKPYTFERNVEKIVIPLGNDLSSLKNRFLDIINIYLKRLTQRSGITTRNPASLSQFHMFKLREEFNKKPANIPQQARGLILADFALCISLYHAYELMLHHGIKPFYNFIMGVINGEKGIPYARAELQRNFEFDKLLQYVKEKYALEKLVPSEVVQYGFEVISDDGCSFVPGHPKLTKLKEIILEHFRTKSSGDGTRAMIFSQYRDSVKEIEDMLKGHEPLIRVMSFVGQSSSSASTGVSQKQQLKIIKDFREGGYNTLVSTCVGEEGLDIGEVDLIVCYDAPKSPIRLVQRMGRTGRQRQGRIVVLLTEGKEEQMYNTSLYKKKKVFQSICKGFSGIQLYDNNPSMVPLGLNPECVKMFVTINPKKPPVSKKVFNRRKRLYPFLTDEELLNFDEYNFASGSSRPILAKPKMFSLMDRDQLVKEVEEEVFDDMPLSKTPILSVKKWMPWQDTLQATHIISHSSKTITLVRTLQAMQGLEVPNVTSNLLSFGGVNNMPTSGKTGIPLEDLQTTASDNRYFEANVNTGDIHTNLDDGKQNDLSESEISVLAVISNKQPQTCKTTYGEIASSVMNDCSHFFMNKVSSSLSENISIGDMLNVEVSSYNVGKLGRKNEKLVSIKLPPANYEVFHFNDEMLRSLDIKDVIGEFSRKSSILSKLENIFEEVRSDLKFEEPEFDDSDFLDCLEFDLNFDHESPADFAVTPTTEKKHLLGIDETNVNITKDFIRHNESTLKVSDAEAKEQVCSSELEAVDYANVQKSSHSELSFAQETKNVHGKISSDLQNISAKPAADKISCLAEFSLTQMVSAVDDSEVFNCAKGGVLNNHLTLQNPMDDLQDDLWGEFGDESEDEYICPTPPPVSKIIKTGLGQLSRKNFPTSCFTGSKLFTQSTFSSARSQKLVTSASKADNVHNISDIDRYSSGNVGFLSDGTEFPSVIKDPLHSTKCIEKFDEVPCRSTQEELEDVESILFDIAFDSHFQVEEAAASSPVGRKVNPLNDCQQSNTSKKLEDGVKCMNSQSLIFDCKLDNVSKPIKRNSFDTEAHVAEQRDGDIGASKLFSLQKVDSIAHKSESLVESLKTNNANLCLLSPTNNSVSEHCSKPFKSKYNALNCESFSDIPSLAERLGLRGASTIHATKVSDSFVHGSKASLQQGTSKEKGTNGQNRIYPNNCSSDKSMNRENWGASSKAVLLPSADFDDFQVPKHLKQNYPNAPMKTSSDVLQRRKAARAFIIDEADVSDDLHPSQIESEGSDLDQYESSFIDDFSHYGRNGVDQQGIYLQSIKNCDGRAGKFKLQSKPVVVEDIYSQYPVENEISDYVINSFVVGNDDIEFDLSDDTSMEYKEPSKSKKKRKRIIRPAQSSSSENEDDSNINHLVKTPKCLKTPEADDVKYSSRPVAENIKYSLNKRIGEKSTLVSKSCIAIKASMSGHKSCSEESKNNTGISPPDNTFFADIQSKLSSPEKISFDISWAPSQGNQSPKEISKDCLSHRPMTSPLPQIGNFAKMVPSEDSVVILVDSRELAGGKPVINALRNQFKANTVVMQLASVDYIVSKELAVKRIMDTEFSGSLLHSKGTEKVQFMCQLYDRCCVIIEKDERRQHLGLKQRCKHLDFSLVLLISSSIKVLFSESPENTAFLLLELAQQERKRGFGIDTPLPLEAKKKQLFEFFVCSPHISSLCALNFVNAFESLQEFLRSSPQHFKKVGHISQQRAQRIYNFFHTAIKV